MNVCQSCNAAPNAIYVYFEAFPDVNNITVFFVSSLFIQLIANLLRPLGIAAQFRGLVVR